MFRNLNECNRRFYFIFCMRNRGWRKKKNVFILSVVISLCPLHRGWRTARGLTHGSHRVLRSDKWLTAAASATCINNNYYYNPYSSAATIRAHGVQEAAAATLILLLLFFNYQYFIGLAFLYIYI